LKMIGFTLFFSILSALVFGLHATATSKIGEICMLLMGILLLFGAFYTIYRYFKNVPIVRINQLGISFNSSTYLWKDLERIELTGQKRFKFILGDTEETASFRFKGSDEVFFFDDMYSNSAEMKSFIEHIVINNNSSYSFQETTAQDLSGETVINKNPLYTVQQAASVKDLAGETVINYMGSQFLCMKGIMLWLLLLLALGMIIRSCITFNMKGVIVCTIFSLIWMLLSSKRLFYFGVSDMLFIVRQHNFFWFKRIYRLSDIKEIVFESHYKMPYSLRVITNDYNSKLYYAGSLWSKKWLQLKDDLEKKDIKVRNEANISYEPFKFRLYN